MTQSDTLVFDPVQQALCPLSLQMRRVTGSVVGRPREVAAIQGELASARGGLTSVTLEGEPGIGKTRLLVAAIELAGAEGFVTVAVSADEELRGPFLLMRSILASAAALEDPGGPGAAEAVSRAFDALSGHDDPAMAGLPPDQKLLRQFDLAAMALRNLAADRPLALFVDDLQWSDEDSLRALRYLVRADSASPIFLLLSMRPEETAFVTEAVTFIADMERMGLVRRLRLARFTQAETAQFLRQLLGGDVNVSSAATVHAQAEGVPFIVEEMMRAYREAGMVQQIDGVWTLARNADRLVPSAVHTLIQRRAGRLPEDAKAVLAEGAVLGRSFSLKDLQAVRAHLGDAPNDAGELAGHLAPAVAAGLLVQHGEGAPADYGFTHEQVREFALAAISAPRRRAVHLAIVEMLTEGGEPPVESLSLLAKHASAAGDTERCARFSIMSAQAALAARAPEEVLRAVELALPVSSGPRDRMTLLGLRDDALEMLRRPADRLEGLAELGALADALGDPHLEMEVMLRRAAALRLAEEVDRAAGLAREVRVLAADRGDREAELAACLELGQALLGAELGEGYVPSAADVDLDGADEAFRRAAALAEELGDEPRLAATTRELGTIVMGRVRAWFVERVLAGEHIPILARTAAGETVDEILPSLPIAPLVGQAKDLFERALELFEKLGDRRGVMSVVIAMAYLRYGPEIHVGANAAQRIEEIRKLATRMRSLSTESERVQAEAQMMFGSHVFARAKMIPDLAVARGEDAYRLAKAMGDRSLEFSSAAGVAMSHLDLGDIGQAGRWLDFAAMAAAVAPTPLRARRLELCRALIASASGDAAAMREHFDRAIAMASDQGRPAARCELLARLSLEAARLGRQTGDEGLLELAERTAEEARAIAPSLAARPPWGAQADAALADVWLTRGNPARAVEAARRAMGFLQSAMREDLSPEIILPTARAILAAGEDQEKQFVGVFLQITVSLIAQRTLDEEVRARWFRGPVGRELVDLLAPLGWAAPQTAGGPDHETATGDSGAGLSVDQSRLLGLLTEGLTNREIAARLGMTEGEVSLRLQEMFARIGSSSRGEATAFALQAGVL